jgi:AbrB family looped-hinge helix DNA binding protein
MPPQPIINTYVVKVRAGYQITIPAAILKELGITIGDLLSVTVQNGRIILTPVKDPK